MSAYAMKVLLPGAPFQEVLERTRGALLAEGFGIPVEMDTRAIFLQKLGRESSPRVILGACLPSVAFEALAAEPDLAVLLPCSVVVSAVEGGCEVTSVRPSALFSLTGGMDEGPAEVVESSLAKALARLGSVQ